MTVHWTKQAQSDLAATHAFITRDSPHYATVVVSRIIAAAERLTVFPESGRAVPEFEDPLVREVIHAPYRIVYRLVASNQVHILTFIIHHAPSQTNYDRPNNHLKPTAGGVIMGRCG